MSLNSLVKSVVPVVLGVVAAGFLMHALRDVEVFRNATRGFDS